MLNTFPELLTYSYFAPTLLRIALGLFIIYSGYQAFGYEKEKIKNALLLVKIDFGQTGVDVLATLKIILGILLVIGLFTQISSLIIIFLLLGSIYIKYKQKSSLPESICFYSFLIVIAVSLLFTGAGLLAFDLPL